MAGRGRTDDLDRLTLITYPDGSTEQFALEDQHLSARKDRSGRWTRFWVDRLGRRVMTRDPEGRLVQQEWCRCGSLRGLVDGEGNRTQWKRDVAGRILEKVYADGSKYEYAYEYSGRLKSETDPMGRNKSLSFFLDDRIQTIDYSDLSTPDVSFQYGSWFPRLTQRSDGVGTTTFTYNSHAGSQLGAVLMIA